MSEAEAVAREYLERVNRWHEWWVDAYHESWTEKDVKQARDKLEAEIFFSE